jgi:hypothetical protein
LGLRVVVSSTTEGTHQPVGDESSSSGIVSFQSNSPSQISGSGNRQYYRGRLFEKPGGEVTVKEEEGSLLPSLERLEANVEEDKTVGAECGDALAESLPRAS